VPSRSCETRILPASSPAARVTWQAAFDAPTNSQIEQERWVLAMCQGRRDGRFAEIGAFDGVHLSNTYRLETDHGWGGLLVEPNPALFAALLRSYVSLDTEGSELDILRTIDLDRHRIALFTIEHNFVEPRREEMRTLLSEAGYQRLNVGFDDWYWHEGHLTARNGGSVPDIAAITAHVKSIYLD
jgi:hypothetical protein